VLAAFAYEAATDFVPRTWIIDPHGRWRWVREGYDESKTYAEFEKDPVDRIDKAQEAE
jgi:hypothetical protein